MVSSMNVIDEPDNELLRQQIVETQEKLTGLERDLHAIDAELDSLGAQRVTYDLLEQACDSLEKLEELGAVNRWPANSTRAGTCSTSSRGTCTSSRSERRNARQHG
jgi:HPt (histidine-containing phosphotransfer) domain-containing protein